MKIKNNDIQKGSSDFIIQFSKTTLLTDFGFLLLDPGEGPCLKADEDGCTDGCNAGDGAPRDKEATDCDVFCFLRDAETVGLGMGS